MGLRKLVDEGEFFCMKMKKKKKKKIIIVKTAYIRVGFSFRKKKKRTIILNSIIR